MGIERTWTKKETFLLYWFSCSRSLKSFNRVALGTCFLVSVLVYKIVKEEGGRGWHFLRGTLVWHYGLSQGGCLFDCVFLIEEKSYHKKPVRTQNQSLRASARKCEPPMPQHQAQENKSEHDVIASDWPENKR